MARREKLSRDENYKSRRNPKNEPSFSSILLDEIFRSTDTSSETATDLKFYSEKPVKMQQIFSAHTDERSYSGEHEEVGSCRKACLDGKWAKKEEHNGKFLAGKKPPLTPSFERKSFQDKDLLFFSSTTLSASETESFVSSKNSCFSTVARPPKPVKILAKTKQEEGLSYNDQKNKRETKNLMIKSKSRASKIYTNFMNMKQPVSPGGKLTSFINSLFSNTNRKESRTNEGPPFEDPKKSSIASYSIPSSASSFSRSSSLVDNLPKLTKKVRNGVQRRAAFDTVSVILDEDLRLFGHNSLDNEIFGRSAMVVKGGNSDVKCYQNQRKEDCSVFAKPWEGEDDKYDNNYDGISDSSSDLFELDHLSMYTNSRFCDGVRNDFF
ncbi:hypothetical protein F511_21925 [Dorcoceras hygrometricum]|uniref:Protein BIG GRAIN 1-like B n=1 Tax=Dorcoceras hygrometricum TaxID=472368 RepID=A0A2Z7CZM0_9LAMI|nr:hypothetical protein F511_21925 [Dorcoceras hygrometricum]